MRAAPWTDEESARLRDLWDRGATRETLCAAFPSRLWPSIQHHAECVLGLPRLPLGWVSIAEAARRAGYTHRCLVHLLRMWGVRSRPHPRPERSREGASRWRLVSWARVERALRAHLSSLGETCREAAARLEVARSTVYGWARDAGVWPSRQRCEVVRLPRETWDRLAAAHEGESAAEAARRLGCHPTTMQRRVRREREHPTGRRTVARHASSHYDRLASRGEPRQEAR